MHILIAEDNEINLRVASKVAISLGHTVGTAGNGLEAVEVALSGSYDTILMDIQMPQMDGLEATRQILAQSAVGSHPYIIAVTANALNGDRESCLEAGMADYLTKPIRIAPLRDALAKIPQNRAQDQPEHQIVLDREQFDAIVDADDPECLEIFDDFCQLARQQLLELDNAGNQENWTIVSGIAHQLKGSSSTFGFVQFSKRISEVEIAAKSANPSFAPHLCEGLTEAFEQAVAKARSAQDSLSPSPNLSPDR